jgi:steroid delta-isomerase-like uncharacterized protein
MYNEDNKALNRRFWDEVFNQKNLAAIDELCRADFVYHGASGPIRGSEAFKRFLQMYFSAFHDLHIHIEDQIAEGEKVVVRNTVTGTHQGALMSIAATGKRVQISSNHVTRLVDGKSVEDWGNEDMLGLLQQLGVIPVPGQAL